MTKPDPALLGGHGLTPAAYHRLEHAASLKGLLQPFKGKGGLDALAHLARRTESQLAELMAALEQAALPGQALLDLRLARQRTRAGSVFLRWRTRDFARMGVDVWAQQMADPSLPAACRTALYCLELDRIALNLQMSVTHSLYRQAVAGADKMALAAEVLRQFPHPGA